MTPLVKRIWDFVFAPLPLPSLRQTSISSSELEKLLGGGAPVLAGVPVNENTALNYSAVWQAVQVIAGAIGSLPLKLYKRLPNGGREEFVEHPLYEILHDEPNPEMTAMSFRQTLQQHVLLWGNGYAEILRDRAGRIAELQLITPDRVSIRRDDTSRRTLYYEVTNGSNRGTSRIPVERMFHLVGMSFDGVQGYSVIARARQAIGVGIASEAMAATFYGNSTIVGSVLQHPGRLSQTAHDKVQTDFENRHSGSTRAHRVAVLEEGMTYHRMDMPARDAQFLETRIFQVQEICRWFNLPPHKLRENTHSTFTNIEHEAISFVRDTLRPWCVAWEHEVRRKLIAPLERTIQYAEHNVDGLERGDIQSRYQAYATARNWGWMNANQIAQKENLQPLPGTQGDMYLVPANMIPADKVGELLESQNVLPTEVKKPAPGDDEAEPAKPAEADEPARAVTNGHVDDAWARRKPQLIAAQRAISLDIVRRNMAREKDKARSAATHGPERLRQWLAGDFYGKYADGFAKGLVPSVRMHLVLTGSDLNPEEAARVLVNEHVADSRARIHALIDSAPADLGAALDDLMTRWDVERINDIPDALMLEEMTHHG